MDKHGHNILETPSLAMLGASTINDDRNKKVNRWYSGFKEWDQITGGIMPGRVYAIAGEAKAGKTAMIMTMIYNMMKQGANPLVFSLEMTLLEESYRLLAIHNPNIRLSNIRDNSITDESMNEVELSLRELLGYKGYWVDSAYTVEEINEVYGIINEKTPIDVIAIDYWQLISMSSKRMRDRTLELEEISRQVKLFANKNNVPVIMAAQLNQEGGTFRSSAPERDWDVVANITSVTDVVSTIPIVDIEIRRSRISETGSFQLLFDKSRSRLYDEVNIKTVDINELLKERLK